MSKNIFLICFNFILLAILSLSSIAHAQDVDIPMIEWEERLTQDDRLTAFGIDLMGDTIDTHIGTITFNHSDISLPGNNGLEVALRRRLTQGYKYSRNVNVEFGDWQLDIPRITALTANNVGWEGNRCSGTWDENFPPTSTATPANPNGSFLSRNEYSNGVSMEIPGYGSQVVQKVSGPQNHPGVAATVNEWYLTCTVADDGGEGYIAHAPNGDKYYFTKFFHRPYRPTGFANAGSTGRRLRNKNIFVAEKIEDVHGNSVNYTFDSQNRLTKIYSSDDREIKLSYSGELITSAETNGRKWTYSYRDSNYIAHEWNLSPFSPFPGKVLDRVTRPDGLSWEFDLDGMQAEPSPAARECDDVHTDLEMTHPNGTKGKFRLSQEKHRQAYKSYTAVVDNCIETFDREPDAPGSAPTSGQGIPPPFEVLTSETMSVRSKTLSGPSIPTSTWTFIYEEDDECFGLPSGVCENYGRSTSSGGGSGGSGGSGGGGGGGDGRDETPEEEPTCNHPGCGATNHIGRENTDIELDQPAQSNQNSTIFGPPTCNFCFGRISNVGQYVEASPAHIYATFDYDEYFSNDAYSHSGHNIFDFTNWTIVTQPDGTIITYYHLWDFEEKFGGKEIRRVTRGRNGSVEIVDTQYIQGGCKGRASVHKTGANSSSSECPTHAIKTITLRDGDTFTTENDFNIDQTLGDFSFGNPVQTRFYSNVTTDARIIETEYEHNTDKWILGLAKKVTVNDVVTAEYKYDSLGQRIEQFRFGKSFGTFAYHSDGTLKSITDAINRSATYTNWYRGIVGKITRPDGEEELQSIDYNGWVTSQTDAKNQTTEYTHDNMGRLLSIDLPGEYFSDTEISYVFPDGGGAVQTITKGAASTIVNYDSMFRQTLVETRLGAGTVSFVNTKYDNLGRTIFTSYPTLDSTEPTGTAMAYDGLGRQISSTQIGTSGNAICLLYTSPSPRDATLSRMPSSA